jgi:hypothetical protein
MFLYEFIRFAGFSEARGLGKTVPQRRLDPVGDKLGVSMCWPGCTDEARQTNRLHAIERGSYSGAHIAMNSQSSG